MSLPENTFGVLAQELNTIGKYPESHMALFGSSVMYLHGIRDNIGDIDMFVTGFLYDTLKIRGWIEQRPNPADPPLLEFARPPAPPVHAFPGWKERGMQIDVEELLRAPEWIRGWPCQTLQQLCMWKASIAHDARRPRDWDDVEAIAGYLKRQ